MQEQQQQLQQAQAEAVAARSKAAEAGRAATQAQHQLHDAYRSGCACTLVPTMSSNLFVPCLVVIGFI